MIRPVEEVRLRFRPPLWPDSLFGHLVATAAPGVEEWRGGEYRRTLRLPHGPAIVGLACRRDHVRARLRLTHADDLRAAVDVCRRLLDLDADPITIDRDLARDPLLRPLVRAAPGRRVPGTVDGPELALRVVLGQQISTAAARTLTGRLVAAVGERVEDPDGGLTHLFPTAAAVAEVNPPVLAMPDQRRRTVLQLATALAGGIVDLGDPETATRELSAIPGVGPWTVSTIAMRALGDADAFLPGDLGVRLAARALGLPASSAALSQRAEQWRPWRAYAVQHLWGIGDHAINRLPPSGPSALARLPGADDG